MPFTSKIKGEAFVESGRYCCICHKFCGTKIEAHHIIPESKGGSNKFENAIPVCFDCHADMENYDKKHPKGSKYTEYELKQHRDKWYKKVKDGPGLNTPTENRIMDVKIIKKILNYLPYYGEAIQFIKNFDFNSANFLRSNFDALGNLLYIMESDPAFEFMDPQLDSLRCDFKATLSKYLMKTSLQTWPDKRYRGFQTSRPDDWEILDKSQRKEFARKNEELNNLGNAVYEKYCLMVKASQRKLGISLVLSKGLR